MYISKDFHSQRFEDKTWFIRYFRGTKLRHVKKLSVAAIGLCGFSNPNVPGGIYLFKVNNRNTRTMCEIC